MNINQLEALLAGLKASGLSGDTKVVLCEGDESDDQQTLSELDTHQLLSGVRYSIVSEKMANITKVADVLVLRTTQSPWFTNLPHWNEYGSVDITDTVQPTHPDACVLVPLKEYNETSRKVELWDGLLGSAAIRILGSAGVKPNQNTNDYAHFGMEIWTHHTGTYDNAYGASIIEGYADKMAENLKRQRVMLATVSSDTSVGVVPTAGTFKGNAVNMSVAVHRLPDLLDDNGNITPVTVKAVAVAQGISEDVTLTVNYEPANVTLEFGDFSLDHPQCLINAWLVNGESRISADGEIFDLISNYDADGNHKPDMARLIKYAAGLGMRGIVKIEPEYV